MMLMLLVMRRKMKLLTLLQLKIKKVYRATTKVKSINVDKSKLLLSLITTFLSLQAVYQQE